MPIEPGQGGRIAELARQKSMTAEELLLDQEALGVSSQNDGGRKFTLDGDMPKLPDPIPESECKSAR